MHDLDANADRLYELLPVVYRERDAENGHPLRALLRLVGAQADLVEQDIAQLWDDFFIETCRPWVIPYIGDLVSNRLLYDASRLPAQGTAERLFQDLNGPDLKPPIAIRIRADVAKTIYYRRRKSTLPMLEELARDVTGWPAHAVEFFELLGWTQHLEHLRFQSQWADVRNVDRMDRVDSAFDEISHSVDVRHIAQHEGWHNIPNIGFFLFRLGAYELINVPAREAGENWRYHFSPFGNPAPLFSRWRREGDEAALATELHIPAAIRRAFFYEDLQRYAGAEPTRPDYTDLYGLPVPLEGLSFDLAPEASFFIRVNGTPVAPAVNPAAPPEVFEPQIVCRRLDDWPAQQPAGSIVGVDPQTGRIVLGEDWTDGVDEVAVDVFYHYGFPAALGGGPYDRSKWLLKRAPESELTQLFVEEGATPTADTFPNLDDALQDWADRGRPDTLISILDSRSYDITGPIVLPNDRFLVIEAANRVRPLLRTSDAGLEIDTLPLDPANPARNAVLTLSGVAVEGHLHVIGDVAGLRVLHSTLVPGRRLLEDGANATTEPSLIVDAAGAGGEQINAELRVQLAFSIAGGLAIPEHARRVVLLDSILDGLDVAAAAYGDGGSGPGPDFQLERSTVFGQVLARTLDMSESIVGGVIDTVRTQDGCVRFSYVRPGSRTPRRYRCQPDLAATKALELAEQRDPALTPAERQQIRSFIEHSIVPSFVTERYGQPPYAQLRLAAPEEIRRGAEDGSEMGVYSHLKQPQRLDNLRLRLDEYLPFGLSAGSILAS